jgi:glycosyltransferase involved in cell wall biosynthesis
MKILYLSSVGVLGGAERVLLNLLSKLRALEPDWELHLWCGGEGPLLDRAEALGVRVRLLEVPWAMSAGKPWKAPHRTWGYFRTLRDELTTLAPDWVHSNGLKMHFFAGLLPRGVRRVWHLHDFVSQRPFGKWLLRGVSQKVDGVLAVSQAVAEDARRCLNAREVMWVPNGVDTRAFAPGPGEGEWLDGLAGLERSSEPVVRVGLVATYARWKGHDRFLEAAARLRASLPRLRFYLVGGPLYARASAQWSIEELRAMMRQLGVSDSVGVVPFREDVWRVYRSLDVVVHASIRPEPFGLSIAEAMACGRAVVAVQRGGAAELFGPEEGVGLPSASVEALAGAIGGLARDGERRRRLGEAARCAAVARFSNRVMAERVVAFYRRP